MEEKVCERRERRGKKGDCLMKEERKKRGLSHERREEKKGIVS